MIDVEYDSQDIRNFLEGRDYLLADGYNWINGKERAITSMNAGHQLNCMNWLIFCLSDLEEETEEVKYEMEPIIINKMEEFKEIFPVVLNKEEKKLKDSYEEKFKEINKEFKEKLKN